MEKAKNPHKQEKQKIAIGIGGGGGGGGIGGVVVWGGVAAIATLVSVSAIRLGRRRPPANKSHHPPPPPPIPPPPPSIPNTDLSKELELSNNNDDQGKGLRVLLQDSSTPIDYHPSSDGTTDMAATQIDSSSLAFIKSSILDDNPVLDISGQSKNPTYLEILLSDNSKPRSSPGVIDFNVQDKSFPVLDKPDLEPGNVNKNEPTEDLLDVEVVDVKTEGLAIEAPQADQFAEEDDNPQMQLNGTEEEEEEEEEGEEHADGEKIVEIGEEVMETVRTNQFAVEGNLEVTGVTRDIEAVEGLEAPHGSLITAEDNRQMHSIETTQKDQFAVEGSTTKTDAFEGESDHAEIIVEKGEEAIETTQKDQFEVEGELEEIEVVKEDDAIKAHDSVQIEAKDNNPQMQLSKEVEYDGGNAVEKDEAAVETVQTDQVVGEDDPQMTLSEEEDNDEIDDDEDEDEEEIVEKGEESSEGTGDSSRESNAEAIWPAESIEELSLELKELMINNQKLGENIIKYRTVETEEHGCYSSVKNGEETGKSMMTSSKKGTIKELLASINLSTDSWNLRIWILKSSVLLMLLLLLLLVLPQLLSSAHIVKLCLIVFSVAILSRV